MVKITSVFSYCFLVLLAFIVCFFVISCVHDESSYGKVIFYNSSGKKSFSFIVSDAFITINKNSSPDNSFPKIRKAEMDLLRKLLKSSSQCLNSDKELSFLIKSRQEKVYDVTFSSLVEQNYNARPVTPITYFGECI